VRPKPKLVVKGLKQKGQATAGSGGGGGGATAANADADVHEMNALRATLGLKPLGAK
jgi:hypothetical protein